MDTHQSSLLGPQAGSRESLHEQNVRGSGHSSVNTSNEVRAISEYEYDLFWTDDKAIVQNRNPGGIPKQRPVASEKSSTSSTAEKPQIAIIGGLWTAILASVIHIVAVVITFSILSLSFATVYWADLGQFSNLNSRLNAFQFAAKLHEILITASLSAIILDRLRRDLSARNGVPFGLVMSGYQLGSVDLLFRKQFWSSVFTTKTVHRWYRLPLGPLVLLAIGFNTVVGPSSAIAMLPKLEWWSYGEPFTAGYRSTFINIRGTPLWPSKVTPASISIMACPGGSCSSSNFSQVAIDHCTSLAEDVGIAINCPAAGAAEIIAWTGAFRDNDFAPNLTMLNSGGVSRFLSSALNENIGRLAISSSVSALPARDLGNLWSFVEIFNHLPVARIGRPAIELVSVGGAPAKKTVVQVNCGGIINAEHNTTVTYPYDNLTAYPGDDFGSAEWTLAPAFDILNKSGQDSNYSLSFSWVDLENVAGKSRLGALFGFSPQGRPAGAYVACTVEAAWVPTRMWIDPKTDSAILQDTSQPLQSIREAGSLDAAERIEIDIGWAETLNPFWGFAGDVGMNLTTIETAVKGLGFRESGFWIITPPYPIPWTLGTILSSFVADGLARVHADLNTIIYFDGKVDPPGRPYPYSGTTNLAAVNQGYYRWEPNYLPFDQVARADPENWVEVKWAVTRLGYGWGFSGITMSLAATVLLIHVLVVFIHLGVTLSRRPARTYKCWDNMTEMLALGLNSRPPAELINASVGIAKSETWALNVCVRDSGEDNLHLMFGDDAGKKMVAGKKYA